MAHNIKIDDKLYEKLRAYCDINGISVTKLCNDAILDYLNTIKFGDAPFLVAEKIINERQAVEEASKVLTKEDLENSGMTVLKSLDYKENGDIEIHMKKLDGPDSVQAKYTVHNDGTVETERDKYHDEDGKLIITAVSAEDGEKQLIEFLSTHTYDEFVKKEEPKEEVKPKRPTKRRL